LHAVHLHRDGGCRDRAGHPDAALVGEEAVGRRGDLDGHRSAVEALVHLAVAVVVDAVADLGAGCAGGAGLRHAADAVVDGAGAGADPAGRPAEALVHLPVAVVVDAVADLGAGCAGRAPLGHAADAAVDGAGAGADPAGGAAEALVHLAVAVVVDAVADLGA